MTERITTTDVREYVRWFQANYAPVPWLERLATQMEADEKNIVKAQAYADSRALAALQEMSHGINLPDMFKVQKDGQAYAVPPETLKGVYEALEQRFLEMRDWSYLRQAESEMTLWLTKLLELQQRMKGRVLVPVEYEIENDGTVSAFPTAAIGNAYLYPGNGADEAEALVNLQAAIDEEERANG